MRDARNPLILDIDGSVRLPLPAAQVIDLRTWQEALRFACSRASLARFSQALSSLLPVDHGTVLIGSGDFHHLSLPLVQRQRSEVPFQLVVLDNHPDNMRYPFGIHCGSWVRAAAALPQVSQVHVVGITSTDIGRGHAWENHWRPLLNGKLTYWSTDVDVGWARRFGLAARFRSFASADALVAAFIHEQRQQPQPSYLSIDKDVFALDVARTNWDQGHFRLDHAQALIQALGCGGLIGSDITGEVSQYRYRSRFKRLLSALDAQPIIPDAQVAQWQCQQREVNLQLLRSIAAVSAFDNAASHR